jgi:ABC-type branched-subunit amino acid transport system substrate-binding protein
VTQILDLALGQWRLTRFALLYPDNPYGRYFAESFQEQCEAMGGSIPASSSYNPDHTDFAEAIRRLAPEKAPETVVDPDTGETRRIVRPVIRFDALFIPDNPARISMIAPQLIYHDILDVQLLGTSLWQSPALLRETGDYIQGAVFPSRFFARARLRAVTEFVETYRRGFETDPTALAAAGYETMTLLKEILLERGVQTRDALRTALQTLTFQGLTGPMAFDARGNIRKSPLFLTVSGSDIGVLPFPQEAKNPPAAE